MALITCGEAKVLSMTCLRLWRHEDPRSIL